MFKKLSLAGVALAMGTVALAPTADAQRYYPGYNGRGDTYRSYDRRDDHRRYNYDRRDRRCSSGTTGTIVGAIAGGLLGRTIDTHGDRTLGTVLGGVGGAVAGNAVEKSNNPRHCR